MGPERLDPRARPAAGVAVPTNRSSAVATLLELLLAEQTVDMMVHELDYLC